MLKRRAVQIVSGVLAFIFFFNLSFTTFAEGTAGGADSGVPLNIEYPAGFKFFAPEEGFSADLEESVPSAAEIDLQNKEIYNSLSPEAQNVFVNYIAEQDSELSAYQEGTIAPGSLSGYVSSDYSVSASITAALDVLSVSLKKLKIPKLARYAFMAIGSSMAVASADGPLPVGDIIAVVIDIGASIVISYYWNDIKAQWPGIVDAFKKAFVSFSSAITGAFGDIKLQVETGKILKKLNKWKKASRTLAHVSATVIASCIGKKDPLEMYSSSEHNDLMFIYKFEPNQTGAISNTLDKYNEFSYVTKQLGGRYLIVLYDLNRNVLYHAHVRQTKDLAKDREKMRYQKQLNIRILPSPGRDDRYLNNKIEINVGTTTQ
ncbi:hypothetical protein [Paenibacillus tengchongensis]|uniref:hypothetical protein n=1 Tax=Paenibacillus tengchongensis TaxID=2608684 RepID=UPI00124EF365|nr:hypothetical protein [Paenibacillus tengchongensis]